MKARFYDPYVGRFLSQDTYLGEGTEAPSLHRYLYGYSNPTYYTDPSGHIVMEYVQKGLESLATDARDMLKADGKVDGFLETATAAIVGVGAGLLEAGAGAADALNYVENQAILVASYSGAIPDSVGSLAAQQTGADYQGMANMAQGVKALATSSEARAQVAQGLVNTYNGVKQGDASAIGQWTGMFGQVGTGGLGGLGGKQILSATASAATKTVNAAKAVAKTSASAGVTVARGLVAGGNQLGKMGTSVVGKAKQAAVTIASNASAPGPTLFQRQAGAVGSWRNNSVKNGAISDISVTPGRGREGPSYSMSGVVDGDKQALGRALTIENNGWTYIDWYEVSEEFAGNRLSDQLLQGIIDHVGSNGKVIEGSPGGINREVLKARPIQETPWAKAFDRLGYDTEYDAQDRVMRSTKRK